MDAREHRIAELAFWLVGQQHQYTAGFLRRERIEDRQHRWAGGDPHRPAIDVERVGAVPHRALGTADTDHGIGAGRQPGELRPHSFENRALGRRRQLSRRHRPESGS